MAKIEYLYLDNGVTLIYQKKPKSKKVSEISAGFLCGAQCDGEQEGKAHLLEHVLCMNKKNRTERKDSMYDAVIDFNAFTGNEYIKTEIKFENEQFVNNVKLVNKIFSNRSFTDEMVNKEKNVVKHEMEYWDDLERNADEDVAAVESAFSKFWKTNVLVDDSYFYILGTPKTVDSIKVEDLKKFANNYFVLENMFVIVSTSLSKTEVLNTLNNELFPNYKNAETAEQVLDLHGAGVFNNYSSFIIEPDVMQKTADVNLVLTIPVQKEFKNLIKVYNMIENYICDSLDSQFFHEMRTKKQLAYTCTVENSINFDHHMKVLCFTTNRKKVNVGLNTMCKFANNIGKTGYSKKEILHAQKSLLAKYEESKINTKSYTTEALLNSWMAGKELIDESLVYEELKDLDVENFNDYIKYVYANGRVSVIAAGDIDTQNFPKIGKIVQSVTGDTRYNNISYPVNITVAVKEENEEDLNNLDIER